MYLHVCHDICLYLPVWTGISAWVYARGAPLTVCETARLSVVRVGYVQDTFPIHMINIFFFSKHSPRQRRVVSGPDHGPRVDVEQGAAAALSAPQPQRPPTTESRQCHWARVRIDKIHTTCNIHAIWHFILNDFFLQMIEDTYTYMNIQTNTYCIHTNMAMIQTNACRYCRGSQLSAQRPQPGPQPWRGSDTAGRRPAGHTPAQARPPSQDGVRLGLTSPRPHESTVAEECPAVVYGLPGRWRPM
jgi:hypothetical protein